MKRVSALAALMLLWLGSLAQAITIDTVPVGDPGNAGELSGAGAGVYGPNRMCGSVAYTYNIGKYEVTASQYAAFLNAVAKTDTYGLYNTCMANINPNYYSGYGCNIQRSGSPGDYTYSVGTGYANRPVNYVNFWDGCRFANWLHNGQPTGLQTAATTEDGVYTLNGYRSTDGHTIHRKAGWRWAVTSEDEWYKAAYYKGGSTNADYWDYPTQSNMIDTTMANYNESVGHSTDVGSYSYPSAYGTFDQGGNVWEWNEGIIRQTTSTAYHGYRAGSFTDYAPDHNYHLHASYRLDDVHPTLEDLASGFRVVEAVPEPSSILALAGGLAGLIAFRRRRA